MFEGLPIPTFTPQDLVMAEMGFIVFLVGLTIGALAMMFQNPFSRTWLMNRIGRSFKRYYFLAGIDLGRDILLKTTNSEKKFTEDIFGGAYLNYHPAARKMLGVDILFFPADDSRPLEFVYTQKTSKGVQPFNWKPPQDTVQVQVKPDMIMAAITRERAIAEKSAALKAAINQNLILIIAMASCIAVFVGIANIALFYSKIPVLDYAAQTTGQVWGYIQNHTIATLPPVVP